MKGIINKGIQDLVEDRFGAEAWEQILEKAGCKELFFAISQDYPDESTVNLVQAVSEFAGLPQEKVMEEYGRYIVPRTLKTSYPTYFTLCGDSPREFLLNMDRVHEHATRSISGAKPPRLNCEELPDGKLLMHYQSGRRLCHVLKGLILGVGDYFGQELQVEETTCMLKGNDQCTMEVTFP